MSDSTDDAPGIEVEQPASTMTIIREQYAVSTGDMGDLYEFASHKDTKQPVLFDDIGDAAALAQVAANGERRPMRVVTVAERLFVRPQPLAKAAAGSA